MAESVASSPEGAKFYAEQDLYDAADPEARLAVTVHESDGGAAGNSWMKSFDQWYRLLPERQLADHEANPYMLVGEVMRLVQQRGSEFAEDLRLRLGIMGLQSAAIAQIKPKEK